MKTSIIFVTSILLGFTAMSQDYGSYIMVDDTITESGDDILLSSEHIYIVSRTKCQPYAQSCAQIRKFDYEMNPIWSQYFPDINFANEHSLNFWNDTTLILSGRNNHINQENGFYHYVIKTNSEISYFIDHPLPYDTNITYGSYIFNNNLYIYGVAVEDESAPGIDVDAIILTYDLITKEIITDYFDYEVNFGVDIYDLQNNSDSTLLFISRRRNFEYQSERDYVIEEIQPDGSRREFYNIKVPNESGIENQPSLEVLSDGRIAFFKPHESEPAISRITRILEADGTFSHDVVIWEEYFPDFIEIYSMTATQDGGFVLVGRYFDRTEAEGEPNISGMLLKIDENGDFSWVRQYKHYHNITDEPETSILVDVKELPNGDLVATGNVSNTTSDLWVIKTNSEGCLGDDDCGETTVGIDENIIQTNYINIYPNPVISGQNLQVEVSSQINGGVEYQLIDMQGRSIIQGHISRGQNSINTSQISTGIYTLVIDLGKRGIEHHKIIIN